MKYFFIIAVILCSATSCLQTTHDADTKVWRQLFNGKDLSGWDIKITKHDLNDNYQNNFIVKDSILKVDYSSFSTFDGQFGHIYTKDSFSYYHLRIEYRFSGTKLADAPSWADLNSGVMLHSQSAASMGKNQAFPVSLEMQFLASKDTIKNTTGNLCTPGTEVSINGKIAYDHCINSFSKNYPLDEWITAEAIVLGDSIAYHIINGDTVLRYSQLHTGGGFINTTSSWASQGFGADSVQWIQKQGMPLKSGHIALQAESFPIEFRKVEIIELEGCTDKKAKNYKSYYLKSDNSKCKY